MPAAPRPTPPATRLGPASALGRPTRAQVVILAEFAAAAATWGIWEWGEAFGHKLYVFPVLLVAWVSYFMAKGVASPGLWQAWGLRVRDWGRCVRWHGAATLLALAVVGALGLMDHRFVVPKHAWIIVALYPVWGFCQQFVLQNGVVANVHALGVPRRWLPVVGMLAFALVHLPNLPLAGLAAMGGLLWTWLWLRAPNLWLLALGHSLVGTAGFMLVLDRDPLLNFPQLAQFASAI